MSHPVPTLVNYHPKPGHEEQLRVLVEKHWGILDRVGLVTKDPPRIYKAQKKSRDPKESLPPYFVEIFSWKDEGSSDVAHQTPEVMAMWEPMGEHLANLEIIKLEPIAG
jgi:hypothetical protein